LIERMVSSEPRRPAPIPVVARRVVTEPPLQVEARRIL